MEPLRPPPPLSSTRPLPVVCPRDEPSPDGISFNVAKDCEQMRICLNRKSFIPSLPDMPARVIDSVVPAHMGGEQPLHKLA